MDVLFIYTRPVSYTHLAALYDVEQMDLISLLVGSDRLVEGSLPCRFLFAPKIHQQLIINTCLL